MAIHYHTEVCKAFWTTHWAFQMTIKAMMQTWQDGASCHSAEPHAFVGPVLPPMMALRPTQSLLRVAFKSHLQAFLTSMAALSVCKEGAVGSHPCVTPSLNAAATMQ